MAGCLRESRWRLFGKRMEYLGELCQKARRSMIMTGVMPLTSIAKDRETALSHVKVKDLIDEANRGPTWVKPASGSFSVVNDIQGLLLAGNAEDIVRETRARSRRRQPSRLRSQISLRRLVRTN